MVSTTVGTVPYIQANLPPTTPSPSNDSIGVEEICRKNFHFDFPIPAIVVCIVSFLVALVIVFFGYRFLKGSLFLTGFLFGSVLIYLVCDKEKVLPPLGNAGVGLGAGFLFGLVTMLVEYVGVFMSGFLTGLLLGVGVGLAVGNFAPPTVPSPWLSIGLLFCSGLLFALMTLKWKKQFLILGTSLAGGFTVAVSFDYILERLRLGFWVWEHLKGTGPSSQGLCWFSWLVLAIWPSIALLGILVQFRITSQGYSHKEGFPRSGKPQSEGTGLQPLKKEGREAPSPRPTPQPHRTAIVATQDLNRPSNPPKSFRQLYQIRRAQGDVICQQRSAAQGESTFSELHGDPDPGPLSAVLAPSPHQSPRPHGRRNNSLLIHHP